MAGIDKSFEGFSRFGDFFAAHRTGNVKQNTDGDGSVRVAEKCDFLFLIVIKNRKSIFR